MTMWSQKQDQILEENLLQAGLTPVSRNLLLETDNIGIQLLCLVDFHLLVVNEFEAWEEEPGNLRKRKIGNADAYLLLLFSHVYPG